jgi:hypothetical protein
MWKRVRKELRCIRKDLKYHILRTDILETKVNSVWYKAALGLAVLGGLSSAIEHFTRMLN